MNPSRGRRERQNPRTLGLWFPFVQDQDRAHQADGNKQSKRDDFGQSESIRDAVQSGDELAARMEPGLLAFGCCLTDDFSKLPGNRRPARFPGGSPWMAIRCPKGSA